MAQMRSVGNLSRRGWLAAAAAAAAWPPAAMAQPQPPAIAAPPEPPGALPEAELQERRDSALRLTTDVFVEGQGPYRFVIDTGASRSVVSDRLAEGLSLPAAAEPTLVHGLAGAAPAPAVMISHMSAGKLSIPIRSAPVLRQSDLGCDGLLGLDAFRGRRVVFDFDHRTVTILKPAYNIMGSHGARPLSEAIVRARQRYGQLTIVDAGVAGHQVTCFIDSGAQMSVGNLGLLNAIKARGRGPRDTPTTTLHGATGDDIVCQVAPVSDLRVGEIHFTDFLMAFADLHTFDLWALKKEPAIMIGMDFLNLFGRVEIDFAENLVRFQKAKRYP